jgi:hypothetical protein
MDQLLYNYDGKSRNDSMSTCSQSIGSLVRRMDDPDQDVEIDDLMSALTTQLRAVVSLFLVSYKATVLESCYKHK